MKDLKLLVFLSPAFVFVFLLGGWITNKPLLPPAIAFSAMDRDKVWQERRMGDGSYMARSEAPGGWVLFVSKASSNRVDASISTNLLFVSDVEHVWIFK